MTNQRVPPFSEDGEKGVLGSILLQPERVIELCLQARMNVDAFYVPAHKLIFTAMGTLLAKGQPVDIRTVSAYLKQKGQTEQAGGPLALDRLIDDTPTATHAPHYIDLMRKAWMRRNICNTGREASEEAYDVEEPEDLRSRMEQKFTDMMHVDAKKTLPEVFAGMEQNIQDGIDGKPIERALSTGYPHLDELIGGGMRKAGVYWLTGQPSTGKTSLKCNIIARNLAAGKRVASLTLEMTIEEDLERMTSIIVRDNITRVIRGQHRLFDINRISKAKELIINSGRFHIVDQSEVMTDVALWSFARRMVSKQKIDLLVIDYLQLINLDGNEKLSGEEQVARKSKCVKDISGALQIPVLCLAQVNRDGGVRYSAQADYDGAGHWTLGREDDAEPQPPEFKQVITLYTKKSRFGIPFSNTVFNFYGPTGYFDEITKNEPKSGYDIPEEKHGKPNGYQNTRTEKPAVTESAREEIGYGTADDDGGDNLPF